MTKKGKASGKQKGGEKSSGEGVLVVALNKRARHDNEVVDTLEAGIVLKGSEVKSIREGGLNLKDSYVRVKGGELFLVACHISPYSHAPSDSFAPERERKLLLHRREIERLSGQVSRKGLLLLPLRVYFKTGRCKVEVGVARPKKLHDKRDNIKSKEAAREIARAMSRKR